MAIFSICASTLVSGTRVDCSNSGVSVASVLVNANRDVCLVMTPPAGDGGLEVSFVGSFSRAMVSCRIVKRSKWVSWRIDVNGHGTALGAKAKRRER